MLNRYNGTAGCTYVSGLGQENGLARLEALKRAVTEYERKSWGLPELKLKERELARQVDLGFMIAREMLQGNYHTAPMSQEAQLQSQLMDNATNALNRLRGRYWTAIENAEKALREGRADYEEAKRQLAEAVRTEGVAGLGVIQWALVVKVAAWAALAATAYFITDAVASYMQRASDATDKSEVLAVAEKKATAGDTTGIAQLARDLDAVGVRQSVVDQYVEDIIGRDPALIRQAKEEAKKQASKFGFKFDIGPVITGGIVLLAAAILLPRLLGRD